MAKGITVGIKGFNELRKKFGTIPRNVMDEVNAEIRVVADNFVNRAVDDAPVDDGILKAGITAKEKKATATGVINWEIVSSAGHSAYMEFGTKSRVKVPSGLESYASQFKGKGTGSYYDFLNSILDWVKRKGIVSRYSVKTRKEIKKYSKSDNERLVEAAERIAFSILKKGVHPHPFFFKQMPIAQMEIEAGAAKAVEKALNK